jgi:Flp pilus assembly protein TadD
LLKLNPTDPLAYNNHGGAHHKKGDIDRAIADYTKAIQLRVWPAASLRDVAGCDLGHIREV